MPRGNPNWTKGEPVPWRFRVRGKTPAGEPVTLGHYRTEEEANSHYRELVQEGYYRQVEVIPYESG